MSNSLNLIVDFNNIAMRAVFMCEFMREQNISNFDTDEECAVLVRKIATDISYIMRMFSPTRTIFACDAKDPWRNSIFTNIEGATYKGNRVKDKTKNWAKIFYALGDLKDILRKDGFIVSEIENAEADDIVAMWKEKLFNGEHENIVMVSSDKDWSQLIEFRRYEPGNEIFCIGYNPIISNKGFRKIYVTRDCKQWLDAPNSSDIFFTNFNPMKTVLKNICEREAKLAVEVVDPQQILMEKIICGDDGDNIPGFYEYYKNGKKVRFTPLRMSKLFESIGVTNITELSEACNTDTMKNGISSLFKYEIDDLDAKERLERQRKLVELNPVLFPENVVEDFAAHAGKSVSVGFVHTDKIKMEMLLKGSKYISETYTRPKEHDIFKELGNFGDLFKL